ncbi:hypothetical protein FOZ62_030378 [Perkinsus olseni]|uniref:Uncharacterized protein n=1 Tax=Perkinsus olseni TaxID=32597 RepID=A0A7J6TWY4_PEROL|nr:hypothetical protein FOZ62_030378 [Perkinsus olseni]
MSVTCFLGELLISIIVCVLVLFLCVPAHVVLREQIINFSVTTAECTLEEDTDMLRKKIVDWYGSEENFNDTVKLKWSYIRSVQRMPQAVLSKQGTALLMFPYIMILWPRLACALSLTPDHKLVGAARDTVILCILLTCRAPLFAVASYRLHNRVAKLGRCARCLVISFLVVLALIYGASTFTAVRGRFFMGDDPWIPFSKMEPYAWSFIILPIVAMALVWWTQLHQRS